MFFHVRIINNREALEIHFMEFSIILFCSAGITNTKQNSFSQFKMKAPQTKVQKN